MIDVIFALIVGAKCLNTKPRKKVYQMRDILIELIRKADRECARIFKTEAQKCLQKGELPQHKRNIYEIQADYFLENGVIVLPCKVGDKTFLLLEKGGEKYDIVESECWRISQHRWGDVYSMYVDCEVINNSLEFESNEFGKTVFLTREEAEAKLKEGVQE